MLLLLLLQMNQEKLINYYLDKIPCQSLGISSTTQLLLRLVLINSFHKLKRYLIFQDCISNFVSFVEMSNQEQVSRATHVEVVGVVMKSEIPGMYSVVNYPSSLAWFFLDVPKLAQAMGFGEDTIYLEKTHKDMDESEPYPVPRHVEDLIRSKKIPLDQHFYTVLW